MLTQTLDQSSETVVGITRSECQDPPSPYNLYYRQDWLKMVGYCDSTDALEALILKYFNCEFDWSRCIPYSHGRKIYPQSARTPNKIILAKEYLDGTVYKVLLDISGTPLMELSEECAWSLCKELHSMGLRCTRFDFAIDDYNRVLDFDVINQAGQSGNFALARTMQPYIIYTSGKSPVITGFSFGSRDSERYLRIYDKLIQSLGHPDEADCIRVEGEFKGTQAEMLFEAYVKAPTIEEALDHAAQCVLGIVSFVDKIDPHLERCPVLLWWQSFVDAVGGTKRVKSIRLVRTVHTIVNFVDRQVKRGLALLHSCLGEIWFDYAIQQWLKNAKEKFGHAEKKFIKRHELLCAIDPSLGLPIY